MLAAETLEPRQLLASHSGFASDATDTLISVGPQVSGSYVVNQADISLRADVARARFGVDGTGQRIGIISDSFDHLGGYAYDVAIGVLPAGIEVLKEAPRQTEDGEPALGDDEGRAMAQLVHSIAPGATLLFATAGSSGPDVFADSIRLLAEAGCTIIVDDITEGGVPWFQDGAVALAVDEVVRDYGVTYFTSAGNFAHNSYESVFRSVAADGLEKLPEDVVAADPVALHDFDPGPGVDVFQHVQIPEGTTQLRLTMQWAQPWGRNQSDVDLFFYDASGTVLLDHLEGDHQLDADPMFDAVLPIPAELESVQVVIAHAGGESPGYLKYVTYQTRLIAEYAEGASTVVGHANSATAAAMAAAGYYYTPAYRESPAVLAPSSSLGGTPIFFDPFGERLPEAEVRRQPMFTTANNGNTSFFGTDIDLDGIPNFSGTSASAPNTAAVAALMLQAAPMLSSADVFEILAATAADIEAGGYNHLSGYGLVRADAAVAAAVGASLSGTVFEDFDRDGRLSAGEQPLAGVTVYLDANRNGQLDQTPAFVGFANETPVPLGVRTLIENPNTPSDRPLERPAKAVSVVQVTGLPGVISDLAVELTLRSDQVVENLGVGPLFVTLVSPDGIRVPLAGTTVRGGKELGSAFDPGPLLLAADGQPRSLLYSNTVRPTSEITPGEGLTRRSKVELTAMVGTNPNGDWRLEVENAGEYPELTAWVDSFQLFLTSAEVAVSTDGDGKYAFEGLPPSSLSGAVVPMVQLPTGRAVIDPAEPLDVWLAAAEDVSGIDFAVTIPRLMPRPPLLPTAMLRVDRSVMGPQPVLFSWSELAAAVASVPTGERFVVTHAVTGRVERWDGNTWVDVTQPPREAGPRRLLADLALRVIRPGDQLRWVPPATESGTDVAFALLGWDGSQLTENASDVSFRPVG